MTSIFISYRHADSKTDAQLLEQALERWFGQGSVFLDQPDIRTGEQWASTIEGALREATIVVVLIGPRWFGPTNEDGTSKLDDPEDWVRREVKLALESRRVLMPVLLGETPLPSEESLPEDIRGLLAAQWTRLSTESIERREAGHREIADEAAFHLGRRRDRLRWGRALGFLALAVVLLLPAASRRVLREADVWHHQTVAWLIAREDPIREHQVRAIYVSEDAHADDEIRSAVADWWTTRESATGECWDVFRDAVRVDDTEIEQRHVFAAVLGRLADMEDRDDRPDVVGFDYDFPGRADTPGERCTRRGSPGTVDLARAVEFARCRRVPVVVVASAHCLNTDDYAIDPDLAEALSSGPETRSAGRVVPAAAGREGRFWELTTALVLAESRGHGDQGGSRPPQPHFAMTMVLESGLGELAQASAEHSTLLTSRGNEYRYSVAHASSGIEPVRAGERAYWRWLEPLPDAFFDETVKVDEGTLFRRSTDWRAATYAQNLVVIGSANAESDRHSVFRGSLDQVQGARLNVEAIASLLSNPDKAYRLLPKPYLPWTLGISAVLGLLCALGIRNASMVLQARKHRVARLLLVSGPKLGRRILLVVGLGLSWVALYGVLTLLLTSQYRVLFYGVYDTLAFFLGLLCAYSANQRSIATSP